MKKMEQLILESSPNQGMSVMRKSQGVGQCGFTKGNLGLIFLITCCGDVTGSGEEERMVDLFYLDISKAFDTFVWIPVGASQRSC